MASRPAARHAAAARVAAGDKCCVEQKNILHHAHFPCHQCISNEVMLGPKALSFSELRRFGLGGGVHSGSLYILIQSSLTVLAPACSPLVLLGS